MNDYLVLIKKLITKTAAYLHIIYIVLFAIFTTITLGFTLSSKGFFLTGEDYSLLNSLLAH